MIAALFICWIVTIVASFLVGMYFRGYLEDKNSYEK